MNIVTDELKPSSTLEQVKKLQELVRKLELQNLQLRNKQNKCGKAKSPSKDHSMTVSNPVSFKKETELSKSDKHLDKLYSIGDEFFDDLEIIRISDIEMSDDECWLYSAPSNFSDDKESSYTWLHKDIDDPKNKELQLTKNALLTKLNDLKILSPLNKPSSPSVENINGRRSRIHHNTSSASKCEVPLDTRTFTRSKKKKALDFLERLDMSDYEKSTDNLFSPSEENLARRNNLNLDLKSSKDANDIKEVARKQEESLKMSSPIAMHKYDSSNSSCQKMTSTTNTFSDHNESEISVFSSLSSCETDKDVFENFYMDQSHSSSHSSPSDSPYNSKGSLHSCDSKKNKLGGYRGSLPNLNKAAKLSQQSSNKESKIQHSVHPTVQYAERKSEYTFKKTSKSTVELASDLRLKKVSNKVPQQEHSFVESFRQNTEVNANVVQKGPVESKRHFKSALPRSSRASSATRSVNRSGIPMPSTQNKKHIEDAWSDGCF